jgi:nucleoid DNA-binding protein
MSRVTCNEIILKSVSEELGLSLNTVRKMVATQFEFVKTTIESGKFESVRLPYLGSFTVKFKEVQMMNHVRGLSPDQRKQFRKDVMTGRVRFNWWENKDGNRNTED